MKASHRFVLLQLFVASVLAVVLSAACAPAATPSATSAPSKPAATSAPAESAAEASKPADAAKPAAKAAGAPNWDDVLAAAKKEGKVTVAGPPGTMYRDAMRGFEQRYPEIALQWEGFTPATFEARFYKEREAGQYLWDVYLTGPTTFDINAKKAGDIIPIRPVMILPEVQDEKVWLGGFKKAFLDSEQQYVFAYQAEPQPQAYVNRDIINEADLSTVKQLLDPKWKGKIAIQDPRVDGTGSGRMAFWQGLLGEDFARGILGQGLAITQDPRQLTEWVVRGQYPIAIGISPPDLIQFQKEGLGKNVVALGSVKDADSRRLTTGWGGAHLISKPPSPNAAIVYLNWLLSKEGQIAWQEKTNSPSRRIDVPRIEGSSPDPSVDYFDIDHEDSVVVRDQAKKLAQELLK